VMKELLVQISIQQLTKRLSILENYWVDISWFNCDISSNASI